MSALKNIFLIIVSPGEGWKDVSRYKIPQHILLRNLYFPLLIVLFCTSYLPVVFNLNTNNIVSCTQHAILSVVKYVFGLYISSFLLSSIFSFLRRSKDVFNKFNNFLIYNLSVLVSLEIWSNLFLDLSFFIIFRLYLFYVIYKGVKYLNISMDLQAKFVVYSGLILLLIPTITEILVGLCIPNYKIF